MAKANLLLSAKTIEEADNYIYQLKSQGYNRVSNCYWYERYEKDGYIVEVERNFAGF